MKKLFFIATLVATVGMASLTYAFSRSNQNKGLSEIQLASIEVLSTDDDPGTGEGSCYDSITADPLCTVIYCGDCSKPTVGRPAPSSIIRQCPR